MRLTLILLLLAFTSCNYSSKEEDKTKVITEPSIDNLTSIKLPLSSFCGTDLKSYDRDSIKKIITDLPDNLRFGGILKRTKTFTALILLDTYADFQIHYLTTITEKGKIIDKIKLFSADCGEDEFYKGESNYTIDNDLKISLSDSSKTYKRTEEGEIIDSTVVKSFHKYEYYVDPKGKVKKYGT